MATTKKKPSAAQIAARKLFAERAKAGTLKKRKSNPATKAVKTGDFVIYRGNVGDIFAVDLTLSKAVKIAKHQSDITGDRFFVEHGRTGKIAYDSKYESKAAVSKRSKNPIKTIKRTTRTKNVLFVVHRANADGRPTNTIALFQKMADAKQYAESYANAYLCNVVVETKYI